MFVYYLAQLVFFFFSSRRRHTRSKRDRSSDVCSSDLHPEPRAPLLDLLARPPAEPLGIAPQRIHADLLAMRLGAGRDEQIEVEQPRRAEPGLPRLRRLTEGVDGLSGTVVARPRHPPLRPLPQLAYGPLLADHHSRAAPACRFGEGRAAGARGDDVRAQVAERREPPLRAGHCREAPKPPPCDVFEEDALHRFLGAEA